METELEMFRRVAKPKFRFDQVTINQAGVAFVVERRSSNEIRRLLSDLNLAVRVRERLFEAFGRRYRNARRARRRASGGRSALASRCRDHPLHGQQRNDFHLVPAAEAERAETAVHAQFCLDRGDPVP